MHRHLIAAYLAIACLTTTEGFLAVLVAPYLAYLGYPAGMVGLLVSVFGIAAFLSRLPSGFLYGPSRVRTMMVGALLAMVGASVLYPVATDPVPLAMVRILNGLGFGTSTTLILAIVMDAIPPGQSTHRPMAVFGAFMAGGFGLGQGVGGLAGDILGYGLAFRVAALLPMVTIFLVLDLTRQGRPRSRSESKKGEAVPWRWRVRSQLQAFTYPEVLAVALASFLLNFLLEVGMTFFPLYGLAIGLSLTEIGLIRSVHSLAQIFCRVFAGELSARFGHRALMLGGLVLMALVYMLVPLSQNVLVLAAIFVAVGTLRAMGFVATTISVAEDIPQHRMNRGVAASVFNSSKDVGNIAGPALGGLIASLVGVNGVFLVIPGLALLLCLLLQQAIRRSEGHPTRKVAQIG